MKGTIASAVTALEDTAVSLLPGEVDVKFLQQWFHELLERVELRALFVEVNL